MTRRVRPVRDLGFVAFLGLFLTLALKRPFLFVLAYAYIDIVAPQRLSYYLLNSIPLSLIVFALAIGGWIASDLRRGLRFGWRQGLLLLLLLYAGMTTIYADVPEAAWGKWDWVWKGMVWAIFLPLALRTRLRIEAYLLTMILSAATIIIIGGIKTLLSGGGYGELALLIDDNSGLYEGSTIACVAIALIPLILWFARFGTIFPPDWRVRLFAGGLVFACLLIPVGTQARTGLVCLAVAAVLMLRDSRRRILWMGGAALLGLIAVPFLPSSFSSRMETIQTYKADQSAGTRLAVWAWTWDYVQHKPQGGGFDNYLLNRLNITLETGSDDFRQVQQVRDQARAYHSAYFEMLGEQGYFGLSLWLLIHAVCLVRMGRLRRRFRAATGEEAWIAPLATAIQNAHLVYMVGALFVGIAWQPLIWSLIATGIAFDRWIAARTRVARPFRAAPAYA